MMALAIFLSYGLQFYVPMNIIGPWFRNLFTGEYAQNLSDSGLRVGLIVFTCELILHQDESNFFSFEFIVIFIFLPFFSYSCCIGTKSWSNHQSCWCIEFIDACVDFPTIDWNRNIRSRSIGSLLLEAVERFGHHDIRFARLLLWFVCKHNGFTESNATSNDVNNMRHIHTDMPKLLSIAMEFFVLNIECEWKISNSKRSRRCQARRDCPHYFIDGNKWIFWSDTWTMTFARKFPFVVYDEQRCKRDNERMVSSTVVFHWLHSVFVTKKNYLPFWSRRVDVFSESILLCELLSFLLHTTKFLV